MKVQDSYGWGESSSNIMRVSVGGVQCVEWIAKGEEYLDYDSLLKYEQWKVQRKILRWS